MGGKFTAPSLTPTCSVFAPPYLHSATLQQSACLQMSLIFGNVTEDDILLQKELEEMASKHKRFKVSRLSVPSGTLPEEGGGLGGRVQASGL